VCEQQPLALGPRRIGKRAEADAWPHPDDRPVAIGVVRSESAQIVKALARPAPPGAAGLRLLGSHPHEADEYRELIDRFRFGGN